MTSLLNGPATAFDETVVPMSPPADVFSGGTAALQVADQFHRGVQIMGRFERSGLVGFKVAAKGRPLRVKVSLAVDAVSVPGWHLPEPSGQVQAAHLPPRLVQVRAQGRLRQCVLLKGGKSIMSAQATFDLMPDEVPDDGLVCVEALDITEGSGVSRELREAVAGTVMGGGTAGLRIDSVAFAESHDGATYLRGQALDGARCEAHSLISCGGLANPNRRGTSSLRTGMFVVNPVPPGVFGAGGRLTIRLGSKIAAATGKPAKARMVRRAVLRAGGEARRLRHTAREVFRTAAPYVDRIISVRDGDLTTPARSTAGNILELDLAAPMISPVLVFVTAREGTVPTLVSATWHP
ncbi:hypothetical protein ACFXJ8_42780 [Nonomuraea sp. NPDC059194]|uniref:hypothetical protein n=1 Tax=Nonomuraea sp. NPDC059194 TaxID=3346764 RepID=UPI003687A772